MSRLSILLLLVLSGLGPAALGQLPDPARPFTPTPTLLDFPAGSEFDYLRGAYPWPTPEADYPLGLSAAYVRRHRIRQLSFRGSGQTPGGTAREPGDLIRGHDTRRAEQEPGLLPFRVRQTWQLRYDYDAAGRLLAAEGRQRGLGSYAALTRGWRVRKRYDTQQRLVEIDLSSYENAGLCPDTVLGRLGWRCWFGYDTSGQLRRLVECRRSRDDRSAATRAAGCPTILTWCVGHCRYDAQRRLVAVRYYDAPDSAAGPWRLAGQARYCYDAAGRLVRLTRLWTDQDQVPGLYLRATRLTYAYAAERPSRLTTESYDASFSALDTLNLCAPQLREDSTHRRPLISGAEYFSRNPAETETYDAQGRLLTRATDEPEKYDYRVVRRRYRPGYLVERSQRRAPAPTVRLLLLRPDGLVQRELELRRADSYDTFNYRTNPWLGEPEEPAADKYDWQPGDNATERRLKQYRPTVLDYRYAYDAAGLLRGLTVRESLNRQTVRQDGAVSAWLTRQLLGTRLDEHARGLRRILRRHPDWPYQQADRQRFTDFRYEHY